MSSSAVVLVLRTPRDPLVEAKAAQETGVLGLEGEGLRLCAEQAQRGTDQLQLEREGSNSHSLDTLAITHRIGDLHVGHCWPVQV